MALRNGQPFAGMNRDTAAQERIALDKVGAFLAERLSS